MAFIIHSRDLIEVCMATLNSTICIRRLGDWRRREFRIWAAVFFRAVHVVPGHAGGAGIPFQINRMGTR